MTMLGRGKRSATDKNKKKSDKVTKAEEAAEAARLAEEAAAKAREAARLAQEAAEEEEAADEKPAKAAKSPQKPKRAGKASKAAPAPEKSPEDESEPPEDTEGATEEPETDADEDEEPEPPSLKKSPKVDDTEADTEAEAEETEADEDDDEDDEGPHRSRLGGIRTLIAVLAVLAVALAAGATALYLKVSGQDAAEQAGKEASVASSRAAQKLSSYDYQTLDADLKSASALTTGKLHTDYEKLAQELRTVAVQQQAVSNTTVIKVGVVSADPDKVVTLVYANRSSVTKNDKQQRLPEPLRIKMTMVKKSDKWLASSLTVIS